MIIRFCPLRETIFMWHPKERADLKMIHDENNVLTDDDELVFVRDFLRKSKHACLYIRNEHPHKLKVLSHIKNILCYPMVVGHWWWWWIVFVVWLINERHLALFPAGTIVRDPHHRESPTRREQDFSSADLTCFAMENILLPPHLKQVYKEP